MMRLALFVAAERNFSVSIERIVHIVARPRVVALPMMKSCFSGVFMDDMEMTPLLRAEAMNGLGAESGLIIVYRSDYGKVGIPAGRVLRIVELNDGEIAPCSDEEMVFPGVEECFVYGGKSYPLLNVDAALNQFSAAAR